MRFFGYAAFALLVGCSSEPEEIPGYNGLASQVGKTKIGVATDHWIEMLNMAGEWERTGLIFGYADDYEECLKAIDGLKKANFAREYRCVPANSK